MCYSHLGENSIVKEALKIAHVGFAIKSIKTGEMDF